MKLSQRGDVSDFGSVLSTSEPQTAPCSSSVAPDNGQIQTPQVSQNFTANAFGLHFSQNYHLAMTPMPAQQLSASPISSRSKTTKSGRPPPCHHARYVLEDKPPRTTTVNENMECTNCGTKNTSAWRRSAEGKSECNACNLFFRKNGRKRPASMRRDTIARRYRLSRCDLCAMEAQGRQPDFAQFQKAVARHRRNGRAALKTSAQQSNECPLPSTLSENADQAPSEEPSFFVPHPDFPPQFSQFVPPNVEYNSQHAMLVGYTTDRALYDVGNVEHPLNPLGDGQVRFARHSHSIVRSPDGEVYGSHLLMTPPTESAAPLEVCKQEVLHEEYNASQGEITSHDGNEQYEQFEQAPAQYESLPFDKKASGNDLVDGNDLENHCVNDYKVVKEEDNGNVKAKPVNGSLAFTASAPGSLLEVQQESISPRDSAFDLLDACPEDDNVLVFRSL